MPRKMKSMPRRRRARRVRRARIPRAPAIRHETAQATYSTLSAPLFPNANVYAFQNFSLEASSQRVLSVAQAYQFFRIKKVTWQLRPAFDTFTSAAGTSVPSLYWRVDKDRNFLTSSTLQTLKASGCRPVRLDDKIITKSFKPAVLQGVSEQATTLGSAPSLTLGSSKVSPWLPTNQNAYTSTAPWIASSIDHLGLLIAIDQDGGVSTTVPCAYISFTVDYEFKKPLEISTTGSEDSVQVVPMETLAPHYVAPEKLPVA